MKFYTKAALAATAFMAAGQANAAVFNLNLSGTLANATTNNFTIGSDAFRTFRLDLSDAGSLTSGFTGFNLNVGDTINATVTLDGALTVPGSNEVFIGFDLLSDILPTGASNNGMATFFNMGPTGLANDTVSTNCGNCLSSIAFLGAQGPVSFFQFQTSYTIDSLTDVDFPVFGAALSYQLRDQVAAVPEPATWVMLLFGFGLVGAAMRRRARVSVSYS
ncbi:MAG: PEPxxWA-CTERM sorting domain-containing protein [Sphingomonadaceae bacterium]